MFLPCFHNCQVIYVITGKEKNVESDLIIWGIGQAVLKRIIKRINLQWILTRSVTDVKYSVVISGGNAVDNHSIQPSISING